MPAKSISDEEKALFKEAMQSVKPLKAVHQKLESVDNSSFELRRPVVPNKVLPPLEKKPQKKTNDYSLSDYCVEQVQSNTPLSYSAHHIPNKRFAELKKGLIPWQSRLDLHGLNSEMAKSALCKYIEHEDQQAHRCLLLVHGKGSHHGEPPILKNHINQWLRQFPQVLAFHSALPRDGGTGAVYVLLKRQR